MGVVLLPPLEPLSLPPPTQFSEWDKKNLLNDIFLLALFGIYIFQSQTRPPPPCANPPPPSTTDVWVPSHAGVTGNEHADAKASKGAKKAYECVMNQKSVQDIWGELGLQEMPDSYDTDSNCSGGSHISEESNEDSPENWPKQPRLT